MSMDDRKLVVLGIPWDVNTEGLRQYMINYGQLDDAVVMKDRTTGRSRGFGYVTFRTVEDAQKVLLSQHILNGRVLEVKIATPKEDLRPPPGKKNTRVFVARLSPAVTDEIFRSYFEKYGVITDSYMPKEQGSKTHRGIGFITFESPESVNKVMSDTHELGGSEIAVDRAAPKESGKNWDKTLPAFELVNSYMNAARFGAFGTLPHGPFEFGGPPFAAGQGVYGARTGGVAGAGIGFRGNAGTGTGGVAAGSHGAGNTWQQPPVPSGYIATAPTGTAPAVTNLPSSLGTNLTAGTSLGNKIFIGKIPHEATADDIRLYFSNYGHLLDVYLPKDKNKASHRGFGFVTFAEESVAERVAQRSHELHGQKLAVDRATPLDEPSKSAAFYNKSSSGNVPFGGVGGTMRSNGSSVPAASFGSLPNMEYSNLWGSYGASALSSGDQIGQRASRFDGRYKPY